MAAAGPGPLADVHRDADAAVAVMLDDIGLALAHRDAQAVALRDVAIAGGGADVPGARQHELRELAQVLGAAAEAARGGRRRPPGARQGAPGRREDLRHAAL